MSLISTDGLESSLREFLEALGKQSTEVRNLRAEVGACATRGDVAALERSVSARLGALEARLGAAERARTW